MFTQPPPPGESGWNTSRLAGATLNTEILGTQQERNHKFVHRDAANAATKYVTQDAHFKIVRKTGSSKNEKQHAAGCKYSHMEANSGQFTVSRTAGFRREIRNKFIAARIREPPWSTKASVRTFREIKHHDVVSTGISPDKFTDKHPREWTKQAFITLGEATEEYMVEVTAEFHCQKQQLMSCRFSSCLQLWQGKEVGYSWNIPTCAWR